MIYNVIIDALLVIAVLLGAVIGCKRGFLKTVAKPVKLLLALFIAFYFAKSLGDALIYPWVYSPIQNKLASYLAEHHSALSTDSISDLPTVIRLAATVSGVDLEALLEGSEGQTFLDKLVEGVAGPVVGVVSTVLAFIVIYLVSRIVLSIIVGVLGKIVEGGVVGFLNGLLGCVFSFMLAVFACWAFVSVFDFVLHLPAIADTAFAKEFTGGFVFKFLENFNPIELLLSF